MWLGSWVAVAVALGLAGSCSYDSIPSLGTSIYHKCGPKKKKKLGKLNLKNKLRHRNGLRVVENVSFRLGEIRVQKFAKDESIPGLESGVFCS